MEDTDGKEHTFHQYREEIQQQQKQALTEVIPLVTSTAPVIVRCPVVGLEVGVLGLRTRISKRATIDNEEGHGREGKRSSGGANSTQCRRNRFREAIPCRSRSGRSSGSPEPECTELLPSFRTVQQTWLRDQT